jgi:hypothetical protein
MNIKNQFKKKAIIYCQKTTFPTFPTFDFILFREHIEGEAAAFGIIRGYYGLTVPLTEL